MILPYLIRKSFSLILLFISFLFVFSLTPKAYSQEDIHEDGENHTDYLEELSVGQNSGQIQEQQSKLDDIRKKIQETQALLDQTKQKKSSLQNEIAYQDNQIQLTTLKIEETEGQIAQLTRQITNLEGVLVDLSEVFAQRAVETYKLKRMGNSLTLFLASNSVPEFISRFHYVKRIQQQDRELLLQMQSEQSNYEDKKDVVQGLHDKLEAQKNALAGQKVQKEKLLAVTKSDEARYQQLLSTLRADEVAIQKAISSLIAQIVSGIATGSPITKGQIIGKQGNTGNVFPRPSGSCPDCGSHLHFMVMVCDLTKNSNALNTSGGCHTDPTSYLNNGQYAKPLDNYVTNQGYGSASCTVCGYAFHTGVDIDDYHGAPIKSMDSGTVYYGTDSAGGKYALVKHKDDLWSAYWHLQ